MKIILIFLVVFALCMIGNVYGGNSFKGRKTTILIRNGLRYKNWLKVHCKSANRDEGTHYMKPETDYEFSFHDDFVGNGQYWCTLSKGPDYKISKTFEAYVLDYRKPHGGSYNYWAKEDGIYHSNLVDPKLHKKYDWNWRS